MKIGLFDHLERSPDRALSTQFDERLEFAAAADEAGLYGLPRNDRGKLDRAAVARTWKENQDPA